jgi:hypothetical protein
MPSSRAKFLQGLSQGRFKTRAMQERECAQETKQPKKCWTDASRGAQATKGAQYYNLRPGAKSRWNALKFRRVKFLASRTRTKWLNNHTQSVRRALATSSCQSVSTSTSNIPRAGATRRKNIFLIARMFCLLTGRNVSARKKSEQNDNTYVSCFQTLL